MRALSVLFVFFGFISSLYTAPKLYKRLGDLPKSTIIYRVNQISSPIFVDIRSIPDKLSYRIRRSPKWFSKISMEEVKKGQLKTPQGMIYYNDPYLSESDSELFLTESGIYIEAKHLSLKNKEKLNKNTTLVKMNPSPFSEQQYEEVEQVFDDLLNEFVGKDKSIQKYGTVNIVNAVNKYHKNIKSAKAILSSHIKIYSNHVNKEKMLSAIESGDVIEELYAKGEKQLRLAIVNYNKVCQNNYEELNKVLDSQLEYLVKKNRLSLANKIAEISLTFKISKSV